MAALTDKQQEYLRRLRLLAGRRYLVDPVFHAKVETGRQIVAALHPGDDTQAFETALVLCLGMEMAVR